MSLVIRKVKANAKRTIKKRYTHNGGKVNLNRIVNDLGKLKLLVNAESKFCLVTQTSTFGTGGQMQILSGIAQGDDYTNRNGNSIRSESLSCFISLKINASATNSVCRVILCLDRERDGSTNVPTSSSILETSTEPLSPYNVLQQQINPRFTVLHDSITVLTQVSRTMELISYSSSLQQHVTFIGTGSSSASLGEGAITIFLISSEGVNLPTFNLYSCYKYYDN
jgi:hypothetical protein